jgi:hypothetical protein
MATCKVNLTPYWDYKPNTVLDAILYTTSGYTYTVTINSGPGITTPYTFGSDQIEFKKFKIPSGFKSGDTLAYEIEIKSDSPTMNSQVQNSLEIGKKSGGDPLSYQGFVFVNDAGSDNDWNDCVVNLALYNDSTD